MNHHSVPDSTNNGLHPSPGTDMMKAALFYQPNDVRYEDTPIPILSPGELLIKVESALTCGTDVKCYRRGHPLLLKHFPSPFGHEFSGVVVKVSPVAGQAPRFQVGDRVVAANSAPCYQCFYCAKGQTNLCDHLDLLNGAYAEYIKIPAQIAQYNTYTLPEHLPFQIAAFSEPLAVCLHGLAQSNVQPGDQVAVMGLGPIGQLMVRAAKLKGARVTAIARTVHKLALAQSFGGADQVVNLSDVNDNEAIRQKFTEDGRGFDIVIEAIGKPETWEKAVGLVRKGGTVNLFGGCPGGSQVSFDTRRLHYDEIKLVSSFHHTPTQFKAALDLLSKGDIDPRPLITDTLPMAQFEAALQQVEAGQAIKIALSNENNLQALS
ncbi:zinc-binding dehydrogenase [Vampirovibrio sp.]|uniref:zinc-dependent alcohol dehydrogenase n=1 Tax=Vampirovibrio sp. TaxID=2717857 RepID=UPI003593E7E8